jgi:glycopeptide antibiotics resistance protein
MLEKMALFGAIGVACAGWTNSVSSRTGRWIHLASLLLIAAVAVGIEWMQVYLLPFVPDFSDAFVYMSGYAAGYVGMKVLWGPTDS